MQWWAVEDQIVFHKQYRYHTDNTLLLLLFNMLTSVEHQKNWGNFPHTWGDITLEKDGLRTVDEGEIFLVIESNA
jgi:hypothetical protein